MARFRFARFILDASDRQLKLDGAPVDINARYLDALILLVGEQGRLVAKDRFLETVWNGVPVTDEALTQCIKTLRKQLGDNAAAPRFIETVPKHGYRFIAPVEPMGEDGAPLAPPLQPAPWRAVLQQTGAGTIGAGVAGLAGGLVYGFIGAAQSPGPGAVSLVLVLMCLTILVALIGGAGVCAGMALAGFAAGRASLWTVAGGAAGGLVIGALGKLVGLDAFDLLLGHSPGDITGAAEGAALGGAVGLGAWLAGQGLSRNRGIAAAGLIGGIAGILISLAGGRLMAGSLDLLAQSFPGSRLRLDQVGHIFGENGFGPISRMISGGLEGALFGACIIGVMLLARRSLDAPRF